MNYLKKPFNILEMYENQEIIGTAADKDINIVNDYDLQEYINLEGDKRQLYINIYEEFKKKFKDAIMNKDIFITDFKCGHYKSIPIRWNYENMMNGYKVIEDKKIWFINALQQKSVIKLDVLFLDSETSRLHEISQNYYIEINNNSNYDKIVKKNIKTSLLRSFKDYYYNDKNFFKAMKRLYSYYKIFDERSNKIKLFQDLFNSEMGKQNKIIYDLKTLLLLMEQTFRPVKKNIILDNLLALNFSSFDENIKAMYDTLINNFKRMSKNQVKEHIENIINNVFNELNDKVFKYITEKKLLNNII